MNFFKRLSGRSKQALRVFFLATLTTVLFCQTPIYRSAEMNFFDLRMKIWTQANKVDEAPVSLFRYQDSTRAAGIGDEELLGILQDMERNGVAKVILYDPTIFQDFAAVRSRLPSNVTVLDSDDTTGSIKDREVLFMDTTDVPLSSLLDPDGNLRRLSWDHPAVQFARDILSDTRNINVEERGPHLLPLISRSESEAGTGLEVDGLTGSAIEYLDSVILKDNSALGVDRRKRYLEGKVCLIERGTVEAANFAEVSTAFRTVTAGQLHRRIIRALVANWTVQPIGWVGLVLIYITLVGGLSAALSGRKPHIVAVCGLLSVTLVTWLSSQLLKFGYDAPCLAIIVAMFFAVTYLVLLEMQRGRAFLESFGGAEDAGFEGAESQATMVFSNLPTFLLEMERNHDENLLKYRREYNEILARLAGKYNGKVLDYQGDAQMLGFGLRYDDDIEHAAEGTAAALEIVEEVAKLASKWNAPPEKLSVHAGVCSGSIALGHLGATQKQDIAAIGDTTNTAARLMGAAMKLKVPVIVAKPTYLLADGLIVGEEKPPVELKGKSAPVEIYLAHSVDEQWRAENAAKDKDVVPSGGTLVYKGRRRSDLIVTIVCAFVGLFVSLALSRDRILEGPETRMADTLRRTLAQVDADPRIVLVGIDEASISDSRLGRFPWSRGVYAQAIRNLKDTGYEGIFFDILYKRERADDIEGDMAFAQALSDDPRAVIGAALPEDSVTRRLTDPSVFPAADFDLLRKRFQLGLIHSAADTDGIIRDGFLSGTETASHSRQEAHLRRVYPAGAAALLLHEGDRFEVDDQGLWLGEKRVAAKVVTGESTINIRYGPSTTADGLPPEPGSYKLVSFNRLLDPTDPIFQELEGKYLLVGQTRTSGQHNEIDRKDTPVGRLKGVEIHARILDNLLNGNELRPTSLLVDKVMIWFVFLSTLTILLLAREGKSYAKGLLGLALGLCFLYAFLFAVFGIVGQLLVLLATIMVVAAIVLGGRYALTFRALTRFIPTEVAEELLYHHSSKDRRQVATVLLTDIRGYTTLSEGRTAVAMLDVLNEYHKRTVACYERHGGQALTYQGDAQIVVFGVFGKRTNPAADAVAAALGLQSICDDLRLEWGIESRDDFDVGAGLCTGEVEVGLLGGASNLQYSVVGETVRKAHKVQSLSAELNAPVILDEETYEATRGAVKVDDLGLVQPKGLPHEIRLFRAVSVSDEVS